MLLSIVALGISIISSLYTIKQSEKAFEQSQRANELAEKAQDDVSRQFTNLNRPLLVARPDSFKPANNYFQIAYIEGKNVIITIPIVIKNVGNMIADNTFLHSTNCRLYLGNKLVANCNKTYSTGTTGNLTLMDIPPNDGVVRSGVLCIYHNRRY